MAIMAETRLMTLQPDGKLLKGARPSMDEEFLLDALRWMLLSRLYDEKVIGLQRQGQDAVVMAYLGDGGSSEGDFHEALNLAGVQKVPIVFFMQNNQWAISTPRSLQSATPSFSLRAAGYGFPGVEVDGNDIFAVYQAAVESVRRARAGEGPTLIVSVTYRMGFHNTTDNPSRYEDKEQRADFERRGMLLGLDVGRLGGVFRTTRGLIEKYGASRVVDTPLAEASIIGASLGLAVSGMVPVAEIQFLGFTAQAFHQIGPQLGKYRHRSRGRYHAQVTIRAPFGGGIRSPEFHSDAVEAQFVQSPGIKVVMPSNPYDAKGMLLEAIRDPDPVLFCEPDRLYR